MHATSRPTLRRPRPVSSSQHSLKRALPLLVIGGLAASGLALAFALMGLAALLALSPRIPSGVTVGGAAVGGLNVEEAARALVAEFAARPLTFTDGDRAFSLPFAQMGISLDAEAAVRSALKAESGAALAAPLVVNLEEALKGLVTISQQANIEALPGRGGRMVDVPVLLDRLRADPSGELADGRLELVLFDTDPLPVQPGSPYFGATTTHIVEAGEELGLIAKRYNVAVADIVALNGIADPDLLYVGQELTIPAAGVYQPSAADAPPPPTYTGKAVVVSTETQRIYAYQDGQLIRSHLASTGLPATPTVKGDFSIYVKYLADDMRGPGYFLPQVPYTMYFHRGYAVHGTYWHNSFGRPMSHGCVNLPVNEAEWWFAWAEVGTPVRVI